MRYEKPTKILPVMILALLVTGCATSTSSNKPILHSAPAGLIKPCEKPQSLPDKSLKQKEIVGYWGKDRIALSDCGKRHSGVVDYYAKRDKEITGR